MTEEPTHEEMLEEAKIREELAKIAKEAMKHYDIAMQSMSESENFIDEI